MEDPFPGFIKDKRSTKLTDELWEELKEEYDNMVKSLSYLSFRQVKGNEAEVEKFCNNDTCEIDLEAIKETQEEEKVI